MRRDSLVSSLAVILGFVLAVSFQSHAQQWHSGPPAQANPPAQASPQEKARALGPVAPQPAQLVGPDGTESPVPPPPLTLSQKPAVQPQVSYRNGQLTISSPNCTLGDILRAIRKQTGAELDVPPNATERVVAKLGPGSVRDVMVALLNGSHFNYVMVGSVNNPNVLERVILMPKTAADLAPLNQAQAQPQRPQNPYSGWVRPQPEESQENVSVNDDATSDDSNAEDIQTDQPAADDEAQQQQEQPDVQPNVKTPEQLLLELQRRQMQRQQQQNQGAPQGFPIPPGQKPEQGPPQQQ